MQHSWDITRLNVCLHNGLELKTDTEMIKKKKKIKWNTLVIIELCFGISGYQWLSMNQSLSKRLFACYVRSFTTQLGDFSQLSRVYFWERVSFAK